MKKFQVVFDHRSTTEAVYFEGNLILEDDQICMFDIDEVEYHVVLVHVCLQECQRWPQAFDELKDRVVKVK